jgi:hypothetical protein
MFTTGKRARRGTLVAGVCAVVIQQRRSGERPVGLPT